MDQELRDRILERLDAGLSSEQVARELGVPRASVSAVKAHVTMGSYAGPAGAAGLSNADVEELEDAADLKFGLERDMQDAIRRNIGQLDPQLSVVDDGRERRVAAGFIDILAEDGVGRLVVMELKAGDAPDSAITQLLAYIGSLQEEEPDREVRGMLVARGFPKRVRLAARAAGIELLTYGFSFTFEAVKPE